MVVEVIVLLLLAGEEAAQQAGAVFVVGHGEDADRVVQRGFGLGGLQTDEERARVLKAGRQGVAEREGCFPTGTDCPLRTAGDSGRRIVNGFEI